eukprot:366400-Chlamydomonas_euryale.AAC.6
MHLLMPHNSALTVIQPHAPARAPQLRTHTLAASFQAPQHAGSCLRGRGTGWGSLRAAETVCDAHAPGKVAATASRSVGCQTDRADIARSAQLYQTADDRRLAQDTSGDQSKIGTVCTTLLKKGVSLSYEKGKKPRVPPSLSSCHALRCKTRLQKAKRAWSVSRLSRYLCFIGH